MLSNSYHDNDKVQPAPSVGEVLDKPQGQPLDTHFKEEDDREYPVHVVEHVLQNGSILEVDIL